MQANMHDDVVDGSGDNAGDSDDGSCGNDDDGDGGSDDIGGVNHDSCVDDSSDDGCCGDGVGDNDEVYNDSDVPSHSIYNVYWYIYTLVYIRLVQF